MKILKIIFFSILLSSNVIAGMNYFNEGLTLYNNKELDKAKFKFEQDIVFNPKNEKLTRKNQYHIGDRIRDMKYSKKHNTIFLVLENQKSLALIYK